MTDIHSHVMFDIDDGSYSIDESIELIKKLKSVGFDNIIMTPHYVDGTMYSANNDVKQVRLDSIKERLALEGIDVNLYIGNEVYINDNVLDNLNVGRVATLNNTKYVLFEVPMHNYIPDIISFVNKLKEAGYIPILAHPERYDYFQRNYSLVDEYKSRGLLFQCNYSSILGDYGMEAIRLIKYMLDNHYVDYLGTDIHHLTRTFTVDHFNEIEAEFIRVAGEEYYQEILNNNDNLVK